MGKVIISPTTQDIENISNKEKLVRVGGGHREGAGKGGFHTPPNPCIVPCLHPIHFTSSLSP